MESMLNRMGIALICMPIEKQPYLRLASQEQRHVPFPNLSTQEDTHELYLPMMELERIKDQNFLRNASVKGSRGVWEKPAP